MDLFNVPDLALGAVLHFRGVARQDGGDAQPLGVGPGEAFAQGEVRVETTQIDPGPGGNLHPDLMGLA